MTAAHTPGIPGWVVSFDIYPIPAEDYDGDICPHCGEFYWKIDGHQCDGPGTSSTSLTDYVAGWYDEFGRFHVGLGDE